MRSFGVVLAGRDNALNLVRLLLAATVIVGHTFAIGGFSHSGAGIGDKAVDGFFALSGYLIAGSRAHLDLRTFLWRRAGRILPGFWVCLAVVAGVFAPLSAVLTGAGWRPIDSATFVLRNLGLTIHQSGISDVLAAAHYPGIWNGSLWTLEYEFACYVLVGFALTGVARWRPSLRVAVPAVAVVALTCLQAVPAAGQMPRLACYFSAGVLAWALRHRLTARWSVVLGCAVLVVPVWLAMGSAAASALLTIPMTYLLLALAALMPARIGAANDVSYGVYIYAFPVEQLLVQVVGGHLGFVGTALATFALTLPFAWASWLWVERPMIRIVAAGRRGWRAEPGLVFSRAMTKPPLVGGLAARRITAGPSPLCMPSVVGSPAGVPTRRRRGSHGNTSTPSAG